MPAVRAALLPILLLAAMSVVAGGCARQSTGGGEVPAPVPAPLTDQQVQLNLESFDTIHRTIAEQHYDPQLGGVDWAALGDSLRPLVAEARDMATARRAMNALIHSLGQSHFVVYPADVYEDAAAGIEGRADLSEDGRERSRSGVPGGSGLDVRVLDGAALVTGVLPGSPAAEAGFAPGWEITHVGDVELAPRLQKLAVALEGRNMVDYILSQFVLARLAGEEGDRVTVQVRDGADRARQVDLVLGPAPGQPFVMGNLPEVRVWTRQEVLEGDIGYFSFNYFMDVNQVMGAFNKAMNSWRDKPGVIMDLRGNPGGLGAMAMGMAGWFTEEKGRKLGTMIMRDGEFNFIINRRPNAYAGRVAILIDGLSASTSEIFAGGMQDLGLARLFGSTTAGAALPSYIVRLPNGDGFQYAVANYFSEDGEVLEGRGVTPDVTVVPTRESLRAEGDPALEAARQWLLNPVED